MVLGKKTVGISVQEMLEALHILGIEISWHNTVDIKNRTHLPIGIANRNHQLTSAFRAAHHVARKGIYIGNDDGFIPRPSGGTNAAPLGQSGARHGALEGAQNQLVLTHPVKPDPMPTKRGVNNGRKVGLIGDAIRLVQQRPALHVQLAIALSPRGIQIEGSR